MVNNATILLLIVVIAFLLGVWYGRGGFSKSNTDQSFIVKTLLRGCARWAVASKQDISPLVSLLHANYAAGYLWAVKDVFTSEQVKQWTGVNIVDLQKTITDIQDQSTRKVSERCPQFASEIVENKELARLAGDTP